MRLKSLYLNGFEAATQYDRPLDRQIQSLLVVVFKTGDEAPSNDIHIWQEGGQPSSSSSYILVTFSLPERLVSILGCGS